MGRQQQITLAAARAAHEARRCIGSAIGEPEVPAFDQLDQDKRISVIDHTAKMLAGESPSVDYADEVARVVSEAIQDYDTFNATQAEPNFEAPVPLPAEVFEARENLKLLAADSAVAKVDTAPTGPQSVAEAKSALAAEKEGDK